MPIYHPNEDSFHQAYNILCHSHNLPNIGHEHPFKMTTCRVPPSGATLPHLHAEAEKFFIISGNGIMDIDGIKSHVGSGDIVHIPPFKNHQLINESDNTPLEFHSVYFFPRPSTERPILAIAAPPTPNGSLHLGHLSGPYIAADIFRRYNQNCIAICGTDDDQTYVDKLNRNSGIKKRSETFQREIPNTLKKAHIEFDVFQQPAKDTEYQKRCRHHWDKLKESPYVKLKNTFLPYCQNCDAFAFGAHVSGHCPNCRDETNGGGCESCHKPNRHYDLENATCTHCKSSTVVKSMDSYVLDLDLLQTNISESLSQIVMPEFIRDILFTSQRTLSEVQLTYPGTHGVNVSISENQDQVLFEWLEMFLGYLDHMKRYRTDRPRIFEFFGIDNSYFYGIFHVALLHAMNLDDLIPERFVCNEFLTLNGKKFSTSRKHAIWAEELLEFLTPGPLRVFLLSIRAEDQPSDFTILKFREFLQKVLIESLETWLHSIESLSPSPRKIRNEIEDSILLAINDAHRLLNADQFHPKNAATSFIRAVKLTQHLIPLTDRSIYIETHIKERLFELIKVFMPESNLDSDRMQFRQDLIALDAFINAEGEIPNG